MDTTVWQAFGLTLLAGLSTGIGSLIALVSRRTNRKFLSVALGFSAGVMIYVSLVEILDEARATLTAQLGARSGGWAAAAAFFGGMLVIALIDRLIPEGENPHEVKRMEAMEDPPPARLLRMGLFTALAIALHNIPEGIAVSVPIYQATGSRGRAFVYSFLSGLAEPLGALAGWLVLRPFMNGALFGVLFAGVAGIMVFISFDELLPAAREYGEHHLSLYGLIAGMALMAVSLLLFL